jgi:hypothetical protein
MGVFTFQFETLYRLRRFFGITASYKNMIIYIMFCQIKRAPITKPRIASRDNHRSFKWFHHFIFLS